MRWSPPFSVWEHYCRAEETGHWRTHGWKGSSCQAPSADFQGINSDRLPDVSPSPPPGFSSILIPWWTDWINKFTLCWHQKWIFYVLPSNLITLALGKVCLLRELNVKPFIKSYNYSFLFKVILNSMLEDRKKWHKLTALNVADLN